MQTENGMKHRILLLEDDPNLGAIVREHLQMNGYEVTLCTDGVAGTDTFDSEEFDLCLVDIMMPKMDGFAFARTVRLKDSDTPLIFLTAKSLQEDKIEGFKIGCDDYITKPFSVEELILRVQAVLKRSKGAPGAGGQVSFEIGCYTFDSAAQILKGVETGHTLTARESELLRMLCLYRNQTLDRGVALRKIWGDDTYFSGRSMDVFVSKLRKYLKDDPRIEILNIRGKGFKLVVESR